MYNKPMCGRSTGTYTNLGDLQRDLRGLSPTPPNKKTLYLLKQLVAGFPPRRPEFEPRSDHVRFVVDNVALGRVFS
jgi:hypothetical protein